MRGLSGFLGGVVATAALAWLAAIARAETCSLELKKVDSTSNSRADYIYRATYPQHVYMSTDENVQFGVQAGVPKFSGVVKKDRKEYQTEHPARGVLKFGTHNYGFVLDSTTKPKEEEGEKEEKAEKKDEEKKSGSLLSALGRLFTGDSTNEPKESTVVPYDLLYFDSDRDGDLTDEKAVKAVSTRTFGSGQYYMTEFPRVDLTVEVDSVKTDYAFNMSVNSQGSGQFSYVFIQANAAAYRAGEITLAGKKRKVVLVDFNSNGRFDDLAEINSSVRSADGRVYASQGDRLYFDPDVAASSTLSPYDVSSSEGAFETSKLVFLDGKFHGVTVSPAGDRLTLEPSDVELGHVSNPNGKFSAVVYGETGLVKIISDDSGKALLPVGSWKLQSYTLDRTGIEKPKKEKEESERSILDVLSSALGPTTAASAPRSTVVSATATTEYKAVVVKKGETAELPFGPPYRPKVDVQYSQGANQVSLGMSLVGAADEICTNMQVNGSRPGKPKVKITTADEKIVTEGAFEYG